MNVFKQVTNKLWWEGFKASDACKRAVQEAAVNLTATKNEIHNTLRTKEDK